jgi:hypothetical protein
MVITTTLTYYQNRFDFVALPPLRESRASVCELEYYPCALDVTTAQPIAAEHRWGRRPPELTTTHQLTNQQTNQSTTPNHNSSTTSGLNKSKANDKTRAETRPLGCSVRVRTCVCVGPTAARVREGVCEASVKRLPPLAGGGLGRGVEGRLAAGRLHRGLGGGRLDGGSL